MGDDEERLAEEARKSREETQRLREESGLDDEQESETGSEDEPDD
jgi:hypothetical protein